MAEKAINMTDKQSVFHEEAFMKQRELAIIIPTYKKKPEFMEIMALERLTKVFQSRKIYFFAPNNLDSSWYEDNFHNIEIIPFDAACFSGLDAYNRMMLDVSFYQKWLDLGLDSVLICQLDVYVISDQLNEFMDWGYDYIGAPLFRLENDKPILYGGNGGFSIRKLQSCINLMLQHSDILEMWHDNEDEFFSYCGEKFPNEFVVAPPSQASLFAFDRFARVLFQLNHGTLPSAIHGWCTYDPAFSVQILCRHNEMEKECDFKDIRTKEKERLLSFGRHYQPIILYGAGLWGKVISHFLRKHDIAIQCFVVSDNQALSESYCGIAVKHISEIPDMHLGNGIIFSVSRKFIGENVFADMLAQAQHRGLLHCFESNVVLFNIAAEAWLEEEFDVKNGFFCD